MGGKWAFLDVKYPQQELIRLIVPLMSLFN